MNIKVAAFTESEKSSYTCILLCRKVAAFTESEKSSYTCILLCRKRITRTLIRLSGFACLAAPLFAYNKIKLSGDEVQTGQPMSLRYNRKLPKVISQYQIPEMRYEISNLSLFAEAVSWLSIFSLDKYIHFKAG